MVGSAQDVNDLIDIARSSFGETLEAALECVQRLAVDRLEAARARLASDIRELRRAALPLIATTCNERSATFLKALLAHHDQDLRVAAVGQLCKMFGRDGLAEILDEYIKSRWYFYNVVTWLDRMIYSPIPIRDYTRRS